MKESQKIYIRGCKDRGDEVKDILTGIGATSVIDIKCDNDHFIYFINHDNEISVALVGSEVAKIIMDNYKEVKFPQRQWNDGYILVNDRHTHCYAVFKKYKDNDTFEAYFILENKDAYFDATASVEHYRLANAKELEGLPNLFVFLMGALNEAGLCLPKKAK